MERTCLVVVQARLSSTRLPGKVLKPFSNGTILSTLMGRLKKSNSISRIVVATSTEQSDNELARYIKSMGWELFRGPLENVFERFAQVIELANEDHVLRVTADCPLVCGGSIDEMVGIMKSNSLDFVSNSHSFGIAKGFDLELFTSRAFKSIDSISLSSYEREHVTPFFYKSGTFHKKLLCYRFEPDISALNLSVDTFSDYLALVELEKQHRLTELNFHQIMKALGFRVEYGIN